jgi:hypothetical protein
MYESGRLFDSDGLKTRIEKIRENPIHKHILFADPPT